MTAGLWIAGIIALLFLVLRALRPRPLTPEQAWNELLGPSGVAAVDRNRAISDAKYEAERLVAVTSAANKLRAQGDIPGAQKLVEYARSLPVGKIAPGSSALQPEEDEALANTIKRLLLSGSFHESRDSRAFNNLPKQLGEMGASIRAGGQERWYRIKERVTFLSGEHWVGIARYYDLLGEPPKA